MRKSNLLIALILLIISSCASKKTVIEAPENKVSTVWNVPTSTLIMPISVKTADLERIINSQLQSVLYDDNSFDNNNIDNLIIKVTKTSPFKITGANDMLNIKAPLNIYVKGRLKKELFNFGDSNFGIDQTKDMSFNIVLNFTTKLNMMSDWSIKSQTQSSFTWQETPSLDLGIIKIPIGTVLEKIVNSQISSLGTMIDKDINSFINIKKIVEGYWAQIQAPQLVNEEYKTWSWIEPTNIALTPIKTKNDSLTTTLGFTGLVKLKTGQKPADFKPSPLPKLYTSVKQDDIFSLNLDGEIGWPFLNEVTKKQLNGKTFNDDNGKQSITIKDINIYGSGNKVVIGVSLFGFAKTSVAKKNINTEVFLEGIPVYDYKTKTISFTQVDYSLKTKDILLKSANWILKGTLKKQLQPYMVYNLTTQINEMQTTTANVLKNYQVSDNMIIKGALHTMDISDVKVSDDGIKYVVTAKGRLTALIK